MSAGDTERTGGGGGCLSRARILAFLDGAAGPGGGEEERAIQEHLEGCAACRERCEGVRREVETRNLSISLIWRQERVSCPHRDLLAAYHLASLSREEASWVRFHVERIGCPYCGANLADIAASEEHEEPARGPLRGLREEVLRSTVTFLRRRRSSS